MKDFTEILGKDTEELTEASKSKALKDTLKVSMDLAKSTIDNLDKLKRSLSDEDYDSFSNEIKSIHKAIGKAWNLSKEAKNSI